MGVRVEICVPQEYPPYCLALLETLFADNVVAAVTKHFTEGQSGAFVFLVETTRQDGEKELPVVIKIGPSHLLDQEWRAAQDIVGRLPDFVPISGPLASVTVTAEDGSTAIYNAARYQLAGNGIFAIETLRDYVLTAPATALWTVLEKRLFQQLDRIWATRDAPIRRRLSATYDRVLPVNLLLEFAETSATPVLVLDATHDPASYPQCQPGDWVQLHNFVVTELDAAEQTLTLNLLQSAGLRAAAYRLRIRHVPHLNQYKLDDQISSLTGRVVKTRQLLLQEAMRDVLPATADLTQPLLALSETKERVPNPLLHWPALLQEELFMRIGTVHGDLNAGNVLVDVAARTTFMIDGVHAHRDHALYDLVRLESEVLLHMAARHFYRLGLPPTKIHELYNWLDYSTRRNPDAPGVFALPQPLVQATPDLQALFVALTIIRNAVRQYLVKPNQWGEYYSALALTLLGSLKFASLTHSPAGTNPKAVAFWGAATVIAQIEQPARLLQLNWQPLRLDEERVESPRQGHTKPAVYIDYPDQSGQPASPAQRRVKILFLTANPLDTVRARTDEEARVIDQALRQAEYRIFDIAVHQAVRSDDLQELLLRHHPDIVHFSGHGSAANELLLQDANGKAMPVRGPALRALFEVLQDQIRCVVLNACYSEEQARSLADVIDCVVGISDELSDTASIQFATAFYRALGYGRSVQEAFRLGQSQIELAGLSEGAALQLYGSAAAQTYFVDEPSINPAGQPSDRPSQPVARNRDPRLSLFQLPLTDVKAWAADFFRLAEADAHARSSWAGMTLYLLGAIMKRISGENFLAFLLTMVTAALAILFITPILNWPQADAQNRLFAAISFGVISLILPVLIAFLIKAEGTEKFAIATNPDTTIDSTAIQRRLLLLKLAGAWTGFSALTGTALAVVILWYHLIGSPMPALGGWLLALLPPFFAYVSARRIPLDRYKMFNGELRLHEADRLFLAVFALFGPGLAAVIYWGHWFLTNRAPMLSVLLGIIGLTVWEIHRHDKRRFPDFVVIAILGLLLPSGFLVLVFLDMPLVAPPISGIGEVGLFVVLSMYMLSTTLLLATVVVRQPTVLTIPGVLAVSTLLILMLVLLRLHLWVGSAIDVGLLILWYLWGRRQFCNWQWLWIHPSVDWLIAALSGATMLGRYTALALWINATLFVLIAGLLVLWAYRKSPSTSESVADISVDEEGKAKAMMHSSILQAIIAFFAITAVIAVFWLGSRQVTPPPIPVTSFVIKEWRFNGPLAIDKLDSASDALMLAASGTLTESIRSALYQKFSRVDALQGMGYSGEIAVSSSIVQPDYWIEGSTRQNPMNGQFELSAVILRGNGDYVATVNVPRTEQRQVDRSASATATCMLILQQLLAIDILAQLNIRPAPETIAAMQATPTKDCEALALNNQAADALIAGNPDSAIYNLEAALRIDPHYGDAYNNMGRGFYQRSEFATAIEFLQKAVKEQPRNPIYNYNLGLAYERMDDEEKAIAAYETALAAEPLYINAINNLGFTLLKTGNITEAQSWIEKGITLDDTVPALHKNQGRILLAQSQPARATAALQKAIALNGDEAYPEALFYLAVAQHETGDRTAACRTLYQYVVIKDIPERANEAVTFLGEWACEGLTLE